MPFGLAFSDRPANAGVKETIGTLVRRMDASVIIPTFERPEVLYETVRALAQIDYPKNRWEVVVVDDGSKAETVGRVRAWLEALDAPARLIVQQNRGPAAARNAGARVASGDILIFLDNDIVVHPGFVRRHIEALRAYPGCWVVGRIVHPPIVRETPFGRYRDDCWETFHRSQRPGGLVETTGMTAANLAVPEMDFSRIGGFDEGFSIASCEDWDLGQRARIAGVRILYDPVNVVVHNDWAVDLAQFCKRQRLYSVSDVLLWRKYGDQSPRARLVSENSPTRWGEDDMRLVAKKVLKRLLATRLGSAAVRRACTLTGVLIPDSSLNRRCYELAVAGAIFRGVREGLARYGVVPGISKCVTA